jgi:hypothetical protein
MRRSNSVSLEPEVCLSPFSVVFLRH